MVMMGWGLVDVKDTAPLSTNNNRSILARKSVSSESKEVSSKEVSSKEQVSSKEVSSKEVL
jgi:hypothetical protein